MIYIAAFLLSLGGAAAPPAAQPVPGAVAAPAGSPPVPAEASVDLFVFRKGVPVTAVEMLVNGQSIGQTGSSGHLAVRIPSGRVQMLLVLDGATVGSLDLLTDEGEIVQLIVSLYDDRPPNYDIESSGRGRPLAGERSEEKQKKAAVATQQPPGALVGTVLSVEDNAPVVGVRIFFSGVDVRTRTNRDGKFAVELPAGIYSVSAIHPEFATQTLDNIRVIPGREVTLALELTPAGILLQEYVVTAPYVEGSIASVLEQQRDTSNVTEVLGADQMSAAGDSNAADALQRVTGLTVEEGRFVLVRGQPSRYTLTLWNGSPLPSPEPLKRVVPLDLFPTGVLSGIEVQKSYSADKPASFGAGLVNLQTRGVPDDTFFEVSLSGGYNSESTLLSGLTYEGGGLDLFGFDDGTRALPDAVQQATMNGDASLDLLSTDERNAVGMSFSNIYLLEDKQLPPDVGVSIGAGGRTDILGDGTLGVVLSGKWDNKWRRQRRIQRSFSATNEQGELPLLNDFVENRTDLDTSLGGLFTVEAEWKKHRLQANTFYVHQTQQRAELTTGFSRVSEEVDVRSFLLSWIERDLVAQQFTGEHDFEVFKASWRGMYARSDRDAPDRRTYNYGRGQGQDMFFVRGNSGAAREFNTVNDQVWSASGDLEIPIFREDKNRAFNFKVSGGAAVEIVDRDALTQLFRWRPDDETADRSETNPEILFDPAGTGTTLDFRDLSFLGSDDYTASSEVLAGYGLIELGLKDLGWFNALRLVAGMRYEAVTFEVNTFQAASDIGEPTTGGFDRDNFMPSVSLTWLAPADMQVRLAYAKTLSRPMFNELSPSSFFDPDSGAEFIGNPDLVPTRIDGFDFRWEWYPSSTETLSAGVFLKLYDDPIERTDVPRAGSAPVGSFQNADNAQVLGFEVGGRFELGRIRRWLGGPEVLDGFFLQSNLALMSSEVQLVDQGIATSDTRPLDGQAEFVFNLLIGYNGEAHDIVFAFNRIGRRLARVGVLGAENIFLESLSNLDLTWTWRIFEDLQLRVSGSNLTNPEVTTVQSEEVWRQFQRGASVSASLKQAL